MEASPDDALFLRDLVKVSRQRIHQVKWVDRDGSARLTVLNQAEYTRLKALAGAQRLQPPELLRRAAHVPVSKKEGGEPAAPSAQQP